VLPPMQKTSPNLPERPATATYFSWLLLLKEDHCRRKQSHPRNRILPNFIKSANPTKNTNAFYGNHSNKVDTQPLDIPHLREKSASMPIEGRSRNVILMTGSQSSNIEKEAVSIRD
jgi:hypothetical protein